MSTDTDKALADAVRKAADRLNDAIEDAAKAGLVVSVDTLGVTEMGQARRGGACSLREAGNFPASTGATRTRSGAVRLGWVGLGRARRGLHSQCSARATSRGRLEMQHQQNSRLVMEKIKFKIVGASPLMMHDNSRLANPLDPLTKEMKAITSKRKKTDDDLAAIAEIEWRGGMYHDVKLGPYLPSKCLQAMIRDSAKISKLGRAINRGVVVSEDKVPLKYDGPRDMDELWEAGTFRDMRPVKVQSATTIRCRPIFNDWSAEFSVYFQPEVINREEVVAIVERAGMMVGVGDYRPGSPNGGQFGRFDVVEVQ